MDDEFLLTDVLVVEIEDSQENQLFVEFFEEIEVLLGKGVVPKILVLGLRRNEFDGLLVWVLGEEDLVGNVVLDDYVRNQVLLDHYYLGHGTLLHSQLEVHMFFVFGIGVNLEELLIFEQAPDVHSEVFGPIVVVRIQLQQKPQAFFLHSNVLANVVGRVEGKGLQNVVLLAGFELFDDQILLVIVEEEEWIVEEDHLLRVLLQLNFHIRQFDQLFLVEDFQGLGFGGNEVGVRFFLRLGVDSESVVVDVSREGLCEGRILDQGNFVDLPVVSQIEQAKHVLEVEVPLVLQVADFLLILVAAQLLQIVLIILLLYLQPDVDPRFVHNHILGLELEGDFVVLESQLQEEVLVEVCFFDKDINDHGSGLFFSQFVAQFDEIVLSRVLVDVQVGEVFRKKPVLVDCLELGEVNLVLKVDRVFSRSKIQLQIIGNVAYEDQRGFYSHDDFVVLLLDHSEEQVNVLQLLGDYLDGLELLLKQVIQLEQAHLHRTPIALHLEVQVGEVVNLVETVVFLLHQFLSEQVEVIVL